MRHRLVIPRDAGKISLEVGEIDASGCVVNEMVRETDTCSQEELHPKHFLDAEPEGST